MFYILALITLALILLSAAIPGPVGVALALLAILVATINLFSEIRRARRARAELRQAMRDF